jgi:hypothetical protein
MGLSTEEVFEAALNLSGENRRELAERLLETLKENERLEIEQAWIEIAKQRMEDDRAGRTTAMPVADFFDERRARTAQ